MKTLPAGTTIVIGDDAFIRKSAIGLVLVSRERLVPDPNSHGQYLMASYDVIGPIGHSWYSGSINHRYRPSRDTLLKGTNAHFSNLLKEDYE